MALLAAHLLITRKEPLPPTVLIREARMGEYP